MHCKNSLTSLLIIYPVIQNLHLAGKSCSIKFKTGYIKSQERSIGTNSWLKIAYSKTEFHPNIVIWIVWWISLIEKKFTAKTNIESISILPAITKVSKDMSRLVFLFFCFPDITIGSIRSHIFFSCSIKIFFTLGSIPVLIIHSISNADILFTGKFCFKTEIAGRRKWIGSIM